MAISATAAVLWMSLPVSVVVWAGHMLAFHGIGFGFELCDRTGALQKYKVRRHERLTYAAALPRVVFNQTFVLLPAMWVCEKTGLAFVGGGKISLAFAVLALVLMTLGHDMVQYVAHRFLLHNARFRWLRHDLHHSTGASRAVTACYMSWPDFFLTIVCPYLIPLVLIGGGTANVPFQLFVACLGAVGGLYEHSGYDFAIGLRTAARHWLSRIPPSLVSSHAHGEHHRRSRVSFSDGFGSPGLCDLIFRTRWDLR